jgi:hypothetical protein
MAQDATPNVGSDLLRIHRAITRALEVALSNSQGNSLPEQHRQGYVLYMRALDIVLHSHHLGEDELAFPFWKARLPRGPFTTLKRHHREIAAYLKKVEAWLGEPAAAWQPESLSALQRSLDGLDRLWCTHIALEEATLGPENANTYLTPEENALLARQLAEHAQEHSQPIELVMPFTIYNLQASDRAEFVRLMPPVVVEQLVPFAWKPAWAPMIPFLVEVG